MKYEMKILLEFIGSCLGVLICALLIGLAWGEAMLYNKKYDKNDSNE